MQTHPYHCRRVRTLVVLLILLAIPSISDAQQQSALVSDQSAATNEPAARVAKLPPIRRSSRAKFRRVTITERYDTGPELPEISTFHPVWAIF